VGPSRGWLRTYLFDLVRSKIRLPLAIQCGRLRIESRQLWNVLARPPLPLQAVLPPIARPARPPRQLITPETGDRASAEQTMPAGVARSGRHSVSTTGAGLGGLADDTPEAYGGPLLCRRGLIAERAANSGVSVLNATSESDHAHLFHGFFLSGHDAACKSRSRGSSELERGAREGAMRALQEKR
jgi:hypothetical protein